ncbi:hypothetical protein ALC53_13521 [Atta colombica]|uniref:Uncharacterized protein n=1 Tax=Atta colombica TaxID=520822 RepID=A0A195AV31_9HYME|nr:hypothetical protein ALC53_13521 [Atta colombica]
MLQSEKTRDDKPRKVFSSSTETPELEGGYRLTRDRSVLHSDLENEILRCVLLRIPQSAPSFQELRPWPECVANFRRNSRNSRAACELWYVARTGVLEWRFGEQHTRGRISGDVVGAALRRDRHSNKQNWRFIENLRFLLNNSIELHELGVASKYFRIRCEANRRFVRPR